MAPRSIWNGTITFGTVNVPVKLFTATEAKAIGFHEVHLRDGARIEHRKLCSKEEIEVESDDVVRGYETSPGNYVVLEREEVKAAAGDRGKVIHLEHFVELAEIDPVYFEKTYYVGSRDDADPYRLLVEALKRSKRAGVGRFSFHDREYLVALRAEAPILLLSTLHFADEIRGADDLDIDSPSKGPAKRERDMAKRLVKMMETSFDPADYEDTYRDSVMDLIRRKAKGEEIDLDAEREPEHGDDLSAALAASLDSRKS